MIPLTANPGAYRYNTVDLEAPKPIVSTNNGSVVNWSTSAGTVLPVVGTNTTLIAPNRTQRVVVTATGDSDVGSIGIDIIATFPIQPNFGYDVTLANKTIPSYGEDDSVVFRVKGLPRRRWNLPINGSPGWEYLALLDFWAHHQKHIPFYYEDLAALEYVNGILVPTMRLVTFDSDYAVIVAGPDSYNIQVVVKEFF